MAIFIASCVETMSKRLGMSAHDMYVRMKTVGLIENYIIPCYDVLHTESRNNLTDDLINTLYIWEEKRLTIDN